MVEKIIEREMNEINEDNLSLSLPTIGGLGVIVRNLSQYDYSKFNDTNLFNASIDLANKSCEGLLPGVIGLYFLGMRMDKENISFDRAYKYFKNGSIIGLGLGSFKVLDPSLDLGEVPIQVAYATLTCGGIGALTGFLKDFLINDTKRKPYGSL